MNREFSIENGFQIVMMFSMLFWWKFLKKTMVNKNLILSQLLTSEERKNASAKEKVKDDLHFKNDFFFLTVCKGQSDDRFERVVEKRLHIPPNKQHEGLVIKEKLLFQLVVDLCEQFNDEYYKDSEENYLGFAINWLKDMEERPNEHMVEWGIWNQTILDVTEKGEKTFGFF